MSFWRPYVPVAQRRARAEKQLKLLFKQGEKPQPVELDGKTIARSFWGKGWCEHLESFSDFENRLPRGRAYVRNGSVCHLAIQPGRIEALVMGSSLYTLSIQIKELKPAAWKRIKKNCAGQIGSMLELLQGKLSNEVMTVVTDREHGLFPQPEEIALQCNCPDWATMCKHVAAVLYGVGNKLDTQPELLFVLRNVDAQELVAVDMAVPLAARAIADNVLSSDALSGIFGIEFETGPSAVALAKPRRKARAGTAKPAGRDRKNTKRGIASQAKTKSKAGPKAKLKAKPKAGPKAKPKARPQTESKAKPVLKSKSTVTALTGTRSESRSRPARAISRALQAGKPASGTALKPKPRKRRA
ncbi:MAG: hypothetical protein HYV27_05880 [Candidatus Hydrogenedentes bacterium]|nr:hypothetical protein [Candidatus Hydrogenedentota bacterium]